MKRYKRILVGLVLGAAFVATGIAVAAGSEEQPTAANRAEEAFAVFRTPAEKSDAIPTSQRPDAVSRRLTVDAPGRLYAQARTNGEICLVYQTVSYASVGCSSAADATSVTSPPFLTGAAEDGQTLVAGLMPDGVEEVKVRTESGVVSDMVRDNAFSITARDVVSLSYTDENGRIYTNSSLALVYARPEVAK